MITSKQRSTLRCLANDLQALYQLGKNGVTEEFVAQIDEALESKELIKIAVLSNAFFSAKEVIAVLCDKLRCEPVSAIGSKIVIYRKSSDPKKVKIVLEEKPKYTKKK
jgi:RNA-binding protein